MKIELGSLNVTLARWYWQLFIALGLSGAYLLVSFPEITFSSTDNKPSIYTLASIGTILALSGSISFAFVIFQMNQANTRKYDLFHKFKGALFDFDKFLKTYDPSYVIISEAQSLSGDLKFIRMKDFPLSDWDDRLSGLQPHFENPWGRYEEDKNLEHKILGYLGYLEELVSEIGMMCIRQIIVRVYVNIVKKVFYLLASIVLIIAASSLELGLISKAVLKTAPVLFGTMASLVLLELAWYLRRESDEMLDFVEKSEQGKQEEIKEIE